MDKKIKSRNYIFTINNYTKSMFKKLELKACTLEKHSYICYGLEEAPETGTKHIQGYVELKDNQRFTFLHNYFDLKKKGKKEKFHIQPAKGTAEQNKRYSSKDGNFFEFGVAKIRGRSDLTELKTRVSENPSNIREIVKEDCNNYQQIRYAENLQKYYLEDRSPKKPPVVLWIHGNTGIGKTRLIYNSFESICSVSDYKWPGNAYQQQECFLLDDFRKEDIPFNTLLKIIDRYPFSLAYKGGFIAFNSPFIIITTPYSIEETYGNIYEDLKQLKRRITKVINLEETEIENIKNYLDENK